MKYPLELESVPRAEAGAQARGPRPGCQRRLMGRASVARLGQGALARVSVNWAKGRTPFLRVGIVQTNE